MTAPLPFGYPAVDVSEGYKPGELLAALQGSPELNLARVMGEIGPKTLKQFAQAGRERLLGMENASKEKVADITGQYHLKSAQIAADLAMNQHQQAALDT